MAVVALIAFGLFNFTGDPVSFMVGQDATAEEKARLRADLTAFLPLPGADGLTRLAGQG